MAKILGPRGHWTLDIQQDQVEVTSDRPTPNESWTYTDHQGHGHHYDRGYPTLDFVIDEQHWCDGSEGYGDHDPHWAVDEAHYECKICCEVIEPATDPPYTPKYIAGARSATLAGRRTDGADISALLEEHELERLYEAEGDDDALSSTVQSLLDSMPADRILGITYELSPRSSPAHE